MKPKLILAFLLLSATAWAQPQLNPISQEETSMKTLAAVKDTGWFFKMSCNINTAQTYLKNWAAGGNSSLNVTGIFNGVLNYRYKKIAWDNTLNLAYGRSIVDFGIPSIKTDDRFDFSSKYGQQASEHWYYSCLLSMRSQLAPGYSVLPTGLPNYASGRISDLLSPAYGVGALGMDYKPNKSFSAFLAPLTYRATFVLNQQLSDAGQFGVSPGKHLRNELGGYVRLLYNNLLVENVTWSSKLELFSNYIKNPKNVDLNWENMFTMKVNKQLSVTIAAQMIYDDDIKITKTPALTDASGNTTPANIGPGLQFKELTAIGFSYTFH